MLQPAETTHQPDAPLAHLPPVEVGWVLVGRFTTEQRRMVTAARDRFKTYLRETFDAFEWRVPVVELPRAAPQNAARTEPVALLDVAVGERDARRWDAALALTATELTAYEKPTAMAAPSASIACAVVSIARLADEETVSSASDEDQFTNRLFVLALHVFGHLGGLSDCESIESFMHPPATPGDLDASKRYLPEEIERLRRELVDIADPRLEEAEAATTNGLSMPLTPDPHGFRGKMGLVRFALRAAWQNRDDVGRAVGKAQPWLLPLRLGRLTTAAASTLLVLVMTAEAWDAGMSQPTWRVVALSILALTGTSVFLLHRQRLLLTRPRRRSARLSEQRSIGNVAIMLAVLLGMITTYALLFGVTLAASTLFYPDALVQNWAASVEHPLHASAYVRLAGCIASLGLVIGALGASFEPRGYFRHVTYVDEET